jgi:hypothetical protein
LSSSGKESERRVKKKEAKRGEKRRKEAKRGEKRRKEVREWEVEKVERVFRSKGGKEKVKWKRVCFVEV